MSTFYYDPFVEFDRLLDDAFAARAVPQGTEVQRREGARTTGLRPKLDLHENKDTNTVEATFELPGLKKDDVSIDVHNNRLTVSGESKTSSEREESGYAIRERSYGKFSRTLQLPTGVKAEDVKAAMSDGVLTVTFPRSTPEAAPKKITVL